MSVYQRSARCPGGNSWFIAILSAYSWPNCPISLIINSPIQSFPFSTFFHEEWPHFMVNYGESGWIRNKKPPVDATPLNLMPLVARPNSFRFSFLSCSFQPWRWDIQRIRQTCNLSTTNRPSNDCFVVDHFHRIFKFSKLIIIFNLKILWTWSKIVEKWDGQWFWVNYTISLTWIKAIWWLCSLLTMIPVRSRWGRYNLPRWFKSRSSMAGE